MEIEHDGNFNHGAPASNATVCEHTQTQDSMAPANGYPFAAQQVYGGAPMIQNDYGLNWFKAIEERHGVAVKETITQAMDGWWHNR